MQRFNTKRVLEADLASVDYTAFHEIVLVRPNEDSGPAIFSSLLVQDTPRGEAPRGLHPNPHEQLAIEVSGDPDSRDVAVAVKKALGLDGPVGVPFGWHV
ncbi:hypothetical protein [Roseateles sp. P5_D6]